MNMDIKKIRQKLLDYGITQRALAKGIYSDEYYISRILNNKQPLSKSMAFRIEAFLSKF